LLLAWSGPAFAAEPAAVPRTRSFHADLSSEEEAKVKPTRATGTADVTVDLATMQMNYRVTFKDLTSEPTRIDLHGPTVLGVDGPPFLDLAAKGIKSPVEGTITITEAQLQYLLLREVYVSIATKTYAAGEIRAWFERRPDQPFVPPHR
jgi:hypothetical protein